jgi:hypothetical protein
MAKKGLLGLIIPTLTITAMGIGLIRSVQENYDQNRPGVVYYSHGKPILQRRFDTNEEFQKYLDSEQSKKEKEYYSKLNNSKK